MRAQHTLSAIALAMVCLAAGCTTLVTPPPSDLRVQVEDVTRDATGLHYRLSVSGEPRLLDLVAADGSQQILVKDTTGALVVSAEQSPADKGAPLLVVDRESRKLDAASRVLLDWDLIGALPLPDDTAETEDFRSQFGFVQVDWQHGTFMAHRVRPVSPCPCEDKLMVPCCDDFGGHWACEGCCGEVKCFRVVIRLR